MGIAMFHLLPESIENIDNHFSGDEYKDSFWKKVPLSFFLAFASYSLILFVEKVAFDSHALIDHDHGDDHGHAHDDHELKSRKSKPKKDEEKKENLISKDEDESDDSDLEEEAMKNVVSSRGKFASFLQMRNSMIDKQKGGSMIGAPKDKALVRASMILRNTLGGTKENEDMQFMVNPDKVDLGEETGHAHANEFKPKSNLTPFLLLIALSLHGFFEGIALGIQGAVKDTLFLFIAIVSHKWAEAFTLVYFIYSGNLLHQG
jgi:zinc transporter ZupT